MIPRWKRLKRRDWKEPFSWFEWAMRRKKEGVLFRYEAGRTWQNQTFARADASTCATYVDANGVVQLAAANVIRDGHYINGVRCTLLEGSRQNSSAYSSDCGAAGVNWALTNVTAAMDATGPDGVTNSAATITTTVSGGYGGPTGLVGYSAGTGPHAVSRWIKRGDSDWVWIGDSQDVVWHRCSFNLANSSCVKGTEVNCTGYILQTGVNGWYRVGITYNSTNAYTPRLVSGIATTTSNFGGNTGTHLAYGAQIEKLAAFPSSYIPTTTAAVTRAADSLSFPFLPVPQAMTVYADVYSLVDASVTTRYPVLIANSAGAAPFFGLMTTASGYCSQHGNGSVTRSSTPSVAITYGERAEHRGVLQDDGATLSGISIAAGTETVTSATATAALAAAWSSATLVSPTFGGTQFLAVRSIKVASGVQTLATMRAL